MVNVISYILKFLSKFNTNYGNFFLIFNKIKRVVISLLYGDCKDQIWVSSPKDGWTQVQKSQNNKFVESKLENWTKMSWTTYKVGSKDKKRKIDWFEVKKIILGTVWEDQFLYISHKFDYNFGSWLLQCFSLDFRSPILLALPSFIPFSLFIPTLHVQARLFDLDTCPISPFPKSLGSSCKAKCYCSGITSIIMWPES